jgi:hypothetical protein
MQFSWTKLTLRDKNAFLEGFVLANCVFVGLEGALPRIGTGPAAPIWNSMGENAGKPVVLEFARFELAIRCQARQGKATREGVSERLAICAIQITFGCKLVALERDSPLRSHLNSLSQL